MKLEEKQTEQLNNIGWHKSEFRGMKDRLERAESGTWESTPLYHTQHWQNTVLGNLHVYMVDSEEKR